MKLPAIYRYTGFYDLLADAIFQHRLAASCTDSYLMNRHARSSVIASALSIECAANCLLGSVELPKALSKALDKLNPLSKIDTALRLKSASKLDRGRNEIQKIDELTTARNDYVHPQAKIIKAGIAPPEDDGKYYAFTTTLEGDIWPALGIPKRAMFWTKDSSLATLKAISKFFKYVFIELLNASDNDLYDMLPSLIQFKNVQILAIFDEFKSEIKNAHEFDVDFSFFCVQQE